ncbi:MAG: large conductance mechanosensitive channel protein MscL [Lachnospiraceae bacterium]|nr:large conductance mechanosensitive channel protein MscL [Lachnospiraceae bacterium]
MKKFMAEFKKFALKGNMIDLAVGVIIGGAFNGLVTSLVNDIIMPVLSLFTGKMDFENWFVALDGETYATIEAAKEAGAATLNYGNFISGIINFIIMAFVVFMLVKAINKLKKDEPAAAPTTKKCPFCKTDIPLEATKCPHCTSALEE